MRKVIFGLVVVLIYSCTHTQAQVPVPQASTAKASQAHSPETKGKQTSSDSARQDLLVQQFRELNKQIDSLRDTILAKNSIQKPACVPVLKNGISGAEWWLIFLPALTFSVGFVMLLYKARDFDFKAALKENEVSKITVINPYYSGQVTDPGETDVPLTVEVTPNVSIAAAVLNSDGPTKRALGNQDSAATNRREGDAESQGAQANAGLPSGQSSNEAQATPDDKPATRYNMDYRLNPEIYPASISRYIALISSILIIMVSVAISCFFIYHYIKFGCPPELGALSSVLLALGFGIVPYIANRVSSTLKSGKSDV